MQKFNDAVKGSAKKILPYQKLIGGVTKQTLETVSTIFAKPNPETDWLDNIDIANI